MPTIETRPGRNGTPTFRVKIRRRGAPALTKTFARKTDAKIWAQRAEVDLREGRQAPTAEARRHTLCKAIERYCKEILPRKPRSAKFQLRQLEWWRGKIGHLLLSDVSRSAIATARGALMGEPGPDGRTRGPATANRYMAALSHVLSVAVDEWEWLDINQARKLRKLKESPGRERFLSVGDAKRLLEACQTSANKDLYGVVLIAMSTGMRRSEILSLRARQISVEQRMIYLYDTKNGERRGVPVSNPALAWLCERVATLHGPDNLLFAGKTGVTPFDIRKPWYAAVDATELSGLRFHDLRHTAASFLAASGASLPEIGAIIGHKSPAMTKRYSHFSPGHLGTVVDTMNSQMLS